MAMIKIENKAVNTTLSISDRDDGINTIVYSVRGVVTKFLRFTIDNLLIHDVHEKLQAAKKNNSDIEIDYPILRIIIEKGIFKVIIYTDYYSVPIEMGDINQLNILSQ